MKKTQPRKLGFFLTIAAVAAFLAGPPAATAQDYDQEYEYEAGQGVHQEEWYDPSDWFGVEDRGIDYENDWYDYTYNYPATYQYDYDYSARGYYGEEGADLYGDEMYGDRYDYYSDTWYDDRDEFDAWYE